VGHLVERQVPGCLLRFARMPGQRASGPSWRPDQGSLPNPATPPGVRAREASTPCVSARTVTRLEWSLWVEGRKPVYSSSPSQGILHNPATRPGVRAREASTPFASLRPPVASLRASGSPGVEPLGGGAATRPPVLAAEPGKPPPHWPHRWMASSGACVHAWLFFHPVQTVT
jgi:hypothetical protein